MALDPRGWIDQHRAAGVNRGNVFEDILEAARTRRLESGDKAEIRNQCSARRTARMRELSARMDAHIDATNFGPIPRDVF